MNSWGQATYGDPCRGCEFSWSISSDDAVSLVAGAPARLTIATAGARGDERHPALAWSVGAYVAHVADNLRIWAERIAGITAGGPPDIARYEENELAAARAYDQIALPAALWTLDRSVGDWLDAVEAAPGDLVMVHPDRGALTVDDDVIRTNAHDVAHHEWDIARILDAAG